MEYFLLYLFTKLAVLHVVANIVTSVGLFVFVVAIVFTTIDGKPFPDGNKHLKCAKWASIVGALCILLLPTQTDVGIIVGGKMAIDIAKSEEVSTISKKIFAVVNKKLDEASK